MLKLNDKCSVKCQVGQVHSAKAAVNALPLFLDGISKATDNIRLQRHGKGGWMAKKETLMCVATCKRKDGKIADYYVHRSAGGGVMIMGPNLERYRCHPGFTNAEAARMEIARVCHVEVISITDGP
jgi:hypothetical protein